MIDEDLEVAAFLVKYFIAGIIFLIVFAIIGIISTIWFFIKLIGG